MNNKNERFNSVPVVVQQIAAGAVDKTSNQNIRYNHAQMLVNIRDFCDYAIREHEKIISK